MKKKECKRKKDEGGGENMKKERVSKGKERWELAKERERERKGSERK